MFIQTETTPNPATLKFLPGKTVLAGETRDFRTPDDASQSPLALRLFAIDGVTGVFLADDFISITKQAGEWQHLKPAILGTIMDHFLSGDPVITGLDEATDGGEFFDKSDKETVETIKELIETRVRPAVAQDGGDIVFKGFRDGVVFLQMQGACAGCPSSTMTLKHGIENLLRHFLPDVTEVRAV
ncbi:NifU-like domain protein [hydrothermal vent metagenome]|uniref:NifU-like domain protein n=1 Tax=hydrothermal vent metagenome TaxID=652676 RepID=A0A3B0TM10_9ZZZZ